MIIQQWHLIFASVNAACGVCHSDLHVMKGEIPFVSPCVVGHEITGEVVEHGSLTDSKIIERCCYINRLRGCIQVL
jgi:threonine dehydrogenase-like Zn-dependent dehydrogenase